MRMAKRDEHREYLIDYLVNTPDGGSTEPDEIGVRKVLFSSLVNHNQNYLRDLFQGRLPRADSEWVLSDAQAGGEDAEYTEAARGKRCGHILRNGDVTYRCKNCSFDDSCILCSKCFDQDQHKGHTILVSVSMGNSGCCDCGDPEAWKVEQICKIHSLLDDSAAKGKGRTLVPVEVREAIQDTISIALNFVCDVLSCSPEQLRLVKSQKEIEQDQVNSSRVLDRLARKDDSPPEGYEPLYALCLWNDEKHSVDEVREVVARACRQSRKWALERAYEIDRTGRTVVMQDTDIATLLKASTLLEKIGLSTTIRSARDVSRENICGIIIAWLLDIGKCSIFGDHQALRDTICEELLASWEHGSRATNLYPGRQGIDTHGLTEDEDHLRLSQAYAFQAALNVARATEGPQTPAAAEVTEVREPQLVTEDADNETTMDEEEFTILNADDGDDDDEDEDDENDDNANDDEMDLDAFDETQGTTDLLDENDPLEVSEATRAGYPPPQFPPDIRFPERLIFEIPVAPQRQAAMLRARQALVERQEEPSPGGNTSLVGSQDFRAIPRTETDSTLPKAPPPQYWLEVPERREPSQPYEDVNHPVRLDHLILFDLRLWKQARINLRDLYITTVVTVPHFKRLLGLRFASIYSVLAQLYLIADREPELSIIHLSAQVMPTPSIVEETVLRGNLASNIMALIYCFLTTKQVGLPENVCIEGEMNFDMAAITNRRLFQFIHDFVLILSNDFMQSELLLELNYTRQFLDLVKLLQGICPYMRATGDHVEYESESWLGANFLIKEMHKVCRKFAEAFQISRLRELATSDAEMVHKSQLLFRNLRTVTASIIVNSLGAERERFKSAEIREPAVFHRVRRSGVYSLTSSSNRQQDLSSNIIKYDVSKQHVSLHHSLHYLYSWLLDGLKDVPASELKHHITFSQTELMSMVPQGQDQSVIPKTDADSYLLAMFDFPIRVCVFLAQIKAGLWVRNGHSLRHQMQQYRGTIQRDYAYPRDILLCQAAMVLCDCDRVLMTIVDRYGFSGWLARGYNVVEFDQPIRLDLIEDMLHLLITILSDRVALLPSYHQNASSAVVRRDIINILCFKAMSYSDICSRMGDKHLLEEFPLLLDELASFRPPEGLSDFGTYSLKPEFLLEVDPYLSTFNRSQRDEAENGYKTQASKQSGVPADQIAYQPTLTEIHNGLFANLGDFTATITFADLIHQTVDSITTRDQASSRVEGVFQMALHLMITALVDHETNSARSQRAHTSFAERLLIRREYHAKSTLELLAEHLEAANDPDHHLRAFIGCHPKIKSVISHVRQQQKSMFEQYASVLPQHTDSDSSMSLDKDVDDAARRKAASAARAKRVMEQFKQQQKDFMSMQKLDFGVGDADSEMSSDVEMEEKNFIAPYPSGNCILCQEETNESRLYGTFGFIVETPLVRDVDFENDEHRDLLAAIPPDLDRTSERYTGVRSALDPHRKTASSATNLPMSTGCGHIMHFSCFEQYYATTQTRVTGQIIRMHPEHRSDRNEFICPLCKAIGNIFYPIIWKGKEEAYPGVLQTKEDFESWLPKANVKTASTDDRELSLAMFGQVPGLPISVLHESCSPLFRNIGQAPKEVHTLRVNEGSRSQDPVDYVRGGASNALLSGRASTPSWVASSATDPLSRAYERLNNLSSSLRTRSSSDLLLNPERQTLRMLASTLGATITATEIAQRGVESTSHLIATIPPPTLMHLRILSETTSSFAGYTQLRARHTNVAGIVSDTAVRPLRSEIDLSRKLWFDAVEDSGRGIFGATGERIFNRENGYEDNFIMLVRSVVTWAAATQVEVMHLIRLAYLRELLKAIQIVRLDVRSQNSELLRNMPGLDDHHDKANDAAAFDNVLQLLDSWEEQHATSPPQFNLEHGARRKFMRLVEVFALPFLRKCVILLHVRYGVKFPEQYRDPSQSELQHLTEMLGLPSITEMLHMLPSASTTDWHITAIPRSATDEMKHQVSQSMQLAQPIVDNDDPLLPRYNATLQAPWTYELVRLPIQYEALLDAASRQRCPSSGNELTDPCICLVCGAIFCGQAFCCEKKINDTRLGGCNQHLRKCSASTGIFISLRKCAMLYLHNGHGSIGHAPYLDKHGEPDMGLRRSRQLFLNQKRYDALVRAPWLNLGVPAIVSRKLEGEVNNGGWETM